MTTDNNVTYKCEKYDETAKCYFVREYTGGMPTYLYKCYIRGNKATLYPHRALFTTNTRREKKELSIFDLRRE